jgi:predicted dehydrogenase
MKKNSQKSSNLSGISRRNFVKVAASGAAALTIIPNFTVSGLGHVPPSDKLHIAAVGCGGEGASDIYQLVRTPKKNAVISCLCDVDDREAAPRIKEFPKASFYHDWREMYNKESGNFDAVTIAIPDHNHAVVAFGAMQLGKHIYLQKPLTHDIFETRVLTEASKKYKTVTQMGDQGASCEGMRTLREWFEAGLIGDIKKVYCWTNRPVWAQGIAWPDKKPMVPKELNWDLWLGTAEKTYYIDNLLGLGWRGWWQFGTGALGDMGCHIIGPPFKLFELGYPSEVSCSISNLYDGNFREAIYPDSGPVACVISFKFKQKNGQNLDLIWMDGGITPERPEELEADLDMNVALGDWPGENDYEGGNLFIGTKGKASCGWGGSHPRLLPLSLNKDVNIPKKYPRVEGDMNGHYWQWIDACIAGYGNAEVDSPFVGYAGPLTETVLMGNLLLRSYNIREKTKRKDPVYGEQEDFIYPGRNIAYKWDGENMRITNFEAANQFIKRKYREGWGDLKL